VIIQEIDRISHTIVNSVEEQSSTINEIAHNVGGTRIAASDIAKNVTESAEGLTIVSLAIKSVSVGTQDTAQGVNKIHTQLEQLVEMTVALKKIVNSFKI
jgi:methyl-accepting chemotaxis protein